jgi:hypothetical protein
MERKCRFKPIFSESVPLDSTQCHIGCKIGVQEVAGSSPVTPTIENEGFAISIPFIFCLHEPNMNHYYQLHFIKTLIPAYFMSKTNNRRAI